MNLALSPDWRWSNDIKQLIGTDSCQATHTGMKLKGAVHYVMMMEARQPTMLARRMLFHPDMMLGQLMTNRQLYMHL